VPPELRVETMAMFAAMECAAMLLLNPIARVALAGSMAPAIASGVEALLTRDIASTTSGVRPEVLQRSPAIPSWELTRSSGSQWTAETGRIEILCPERGVLPSCIFFMGLGYHTRYGEEV